MEYNLDIDYQRREFDERIAELKDARCVVELHKVYPKRTIQQNKYLHLIIGWWALHYGCTDEYAKRKFFKLECNKDTFLVIRESKAGNQYYDLLSSKDITTEQMTICIERFRNYCAEHGCYIPSPDERQYLTYIQREQEKNKKYL